ncbi:hypothetical protein MHBO_000589 [Bonamia ostreae]|uniref:RAP domain-containing protein n=1 Tax=Bonamia ostreae TaxID=126728 RepID=A0ABV2AG73_9EUKA
MNYCEELLFKNIASQAVKTIKEFAPQNISNLIWSFGALKIGETELLEKIIDESLKRLEEFNTQNLSNLAWSLAQLVPASRYNDVLFEEVSAVCIIKTEYFNARYFSNLLWAFAVAGFFPEPLVERAIDYMNTAEPSELEDLGAAYKAQWYQVDLTLKLERPVFSRRVSLRKAILTLVSREFLKNEIVSSENSVEVNNILNFLQLDYSSNFILNEGFVVSNMLQPESQRVAVNFLGPHNFLKSSLEMSGESALRGRLLKEIGWKIAVIEHKELERCNNFEQKVRLVADRLLNVGIQIHDQILSPLIDCRQNEMVDFKKSDFFGDDGRLDSLAMGVSGYFNWSML